MAGTDTYEGSDTRPIDVDKLAEQLGVTTGAALLADIPEEKQDELILQHGFTEEAKLKCGECDETFDESDAGPALYECVECSKVFNRDEGGGKGHICPDCMNKMGTKINTMSCPECGSGSEDEFESVTMYNCNECEEDLEGDEEALEHFREHDDWEQLVLQFSERPAPPPPVVTAATVAGARKNSSRRKVVDGVSQATRIRQLHAEGVATADIARRIGCPYASVRAALKAVAKAS